MDDFKASKQDHQSVEDSRSSLEHGPNPGQDHGLSNLDNSSGQIHMPNADSNPLRDCRQHIGHEYHGLEQDCKRQTKNGTHHREEEEMAVNRQSDEGEEDEVESCTVLMEGIPSSKNEDTLRRLVQEGMVTFVYKENAGECILLCSATAFDKYTMYVCCSL